MYHPDEVWIQVFINFETTLPLEGWWKYGDQFRGLETQTNEATLITLCQVCRQFRRIAQPILFRAVLEGVTEDRAFKWLTGLTAALLGTTLGQHVRIISTENPGDVPDQYVSILKDAVVREPQLESSLELLLQYLLHFYYERDDRPCSAALILALSPNATIFDCIIRESFDSIKYPILEIEILSGHLDLERLVKSILPEEDFQGIQVAPAMCHVGTPNNRTFRLEHLQEVRLRTGGGCDGSDSIRLIEPVLQHPTLQTLRLLGTNWTGFEVNRGLRWPQATSNIQVLDLKECVIDADGLEDVFRRCPKLRELRIDLGDWRRVRDSDLDDDWELDLEKFGEIIRRCGGNLETFGLNTVEYKSYYDTDGKLGSFRALHDLKKLLIIPKDWVGIDSSTADGQPLPAKPMKENLPESLEWLHLYYNDDAFGPTTDNLARIDVDTQLYNLITSERVPNLRKVTVERIFGLSNDFEYKDFVRGWESNVTKMHNWVS